MANVQGAPKNLAGRGWSDTTYVKRLSLKLLPGAKRIANQTGLLGEEEGVARRDAHPVSQRHYTSLKGQVGFAPSVDWSKVMDIGTLAMGKEPLFLI